MPTPGEEHEDRADLLGQEFFKHFERSNTKGAILGFLRAMSTLQPKKQQ